MICERTYAEPTRFASADLDRDFLTLIAEPTPKRSRRSRRQSSRKNSLMRRLEVGFISIAVIGAFAALTSSAVSWWRTTEQTSSPAASYATVTVAKGDTLWSIARQNSTPSQFVSDKLEQIRTVNPNLRSGQQLVPGQTLLVPVNAPVTSDRLHLAQATDTQRTF